MSSDPKRIPRLPSDSPRPREGLALFQEGARFILATWALMRTAVEEEWGGPASRAKATRIVDDLIDNCVEQWREGHDLHIDTLDVYLLECLEEDFNVDFEDDTPVTAVSLLLQELYRNCAAGDLDKSRVQLSGLASHPAMQSAMVRAPGGGGDDDSSGSDEDDDGGGVGGSTGGGLSAGVSRGPKRVVDDDGWETVVPKAAAKRGGSVAVPATTGGAQPAAMPPPPPSTSSGTDGSTGGMDVEGEQ